MKINKLLCCLAILTSYSKTKSMELAQDKSAHINNFFPEEILKQILSEAGSKINLTSQVCRQFHEINKLILQQSWNKLKTQKNRYCIFCTINLLGNQTQSQPTYNSLSKLYCKLHNHLDQQPDKSQEPDLTDIKLYLQLDQKLQESQDQNLILAWQKLQSKLGKQEEKTSNAQQARQQLTSKYGKSTAIKVIELDLSWSYLTQVPIELSYFTNLRELQLQSNNLKSINILEALGRLEKLHLWENYLEWITIPNNLTNLQELYLSQNKLTSLKIPGNCVKLKDLRIDYNQLGSMNIPKTLTNLQHLDLEGNRLNRIEIPETLIKLEVLRISDNKLTLVKIPDIITSKVKIIGLPDNNQSCTIS